MSGKNPTLVIDRIDNQGDRLVIYPKADGKAIGYHVIASVEEVERLKVGDIIEHQPDGANFGWFISKCE